MTDFIGNADKIRLMNFADGKFVEAGGRHRELIDLPVIGACARCHMTASVAVPPDFDFRMGDKFMAGKIVKAACPRCRQETEFRSLSPEELGREAPYIMRRYFEIFVKTRIEGKPAPVGVEEFVTAYIEKVRHVALPILRKELEDRDARLASLERSLKAGQIGADRYAGVKAELESERSKIVAEIARIDKPVEVPREEKPRIIVA